MNSNAPEIQFDSIYNIRDQLIRFMAIEMVIEIVVNI